MVENVEAAGAGEVIDQDVAPDFINVMLDIFFF